MSHHKDIDLDTVTLTRKNLPTGVYYQYNIQNKPLVCYSEFMPYKGLSKNSKYVKSFDFVNDTDLKSFLNLLIMKIDRGKYYDYPRTVHYVINNHILLGIYENDSITYKKVFIGVLDKELKKNNVMIRFTIGVHISNNMSLIDNCRCDLVIIMCNYSVQHINFHGLPNLNDLININASRRKNKCIAYLSINDKELLFNMPLFHDIKLYDSKNNDCNKIKLEKYTYDVVKKIKENLFELFKHRYKNSNNAIIKRLVTTNIENIIHNNILKINTTTTFYIEHAENIYKQISDNDKISFIKNKTTQNYNLYMIIKIPYILEMNDQHSNIKMPIYVDKIYFSQSSTIGQWYYPNFNNVNDNINESKLVKKFETYEN